MTETVMQREKQVLGLEQVNERTLFVVVLFSNYYLIDIFNIIFSLLPGNLKNFSLLFVQYIRA